MLHIAKLVSKAHGNICHYFGTRADCQAHADHNAEKFVREMRPAKPQEIQGIQQVTGAKPQKVADDVVHYASCVLERC